jgi:hypothetical protein
MDKTELKELLKEFKEGKSSVFDRKNTSITFRCSIPLKVWIHQQAAEKGFDSVSSYIEQSLLTAEKAEEIKANEKVVSELLSEQQQRIQELEQTCKNLEEKCEQFKLKHQKIKELCQKGVQAPIENRRDFFEFIGVLGQSL